MHVTHMEGFNILLMRSIHILEAIRALLRTYLRTIVVNEHSILRNIHVLLCDLQFEYLQECAKDMHRVNHDF